MSNQLGAAKARSVSPPCRRRDRRRQGVQDNRRAPGLEEKNINITVSGDVLTLKGEKHYEKDEQDQNRYVSERAYGSFQRSFALPDGVDRDKIAADLSKGVLTLTLPKATGAQKPRRKIEVKTAV